MNVLTADVGGTTTRLCVAEVTTGKLRLSGLQRFRSREFAGLQAILTHYASTLDTRVDALAVGIAGPVLNGLCKATNLPWQVDIDALVTALGWPCGFLLNDLEATAWGIAVLGDDDYAVLNPGRECAGNAAVIAAGTGLGQAGLYWDGARYHPFATEGGHTDFSPENSRELTLQAWLADRYGHVSWERLVSGTGLEDIYRFLLHDRGAPQPGWLQGQDDIAGAVSSAALAGRDPLCAEALDMFVNLLGREAGNLALKMMARGGIYLAGGIPPKILDRLRQDDFLKAFCAKGRMASLLEDIPVRVVLDDSAGLHGAASYAYARLVEGNA